MESVLYAYYLGVIGVTRSPVLLPLAPPRLFSHPPTSHVTKPFSSTG
jgi:hypothetical protein